MFVVDFGLTKGELVECVSHKEGELSEHLRPAFDNTD